MDQFTISYDSYETVTLPYQTLQISPPFGLAAVPVVGGGTFAAGNYFWEVTALTALGETTVSNEATAAIALNGQAQLSWNLPAGTVTGIKVYRGTAVGAENALIASLPPQTGYLDTGTAGSVATPPVANTATVVDTTLITGAGVFLGYSLRETSGTNAADVRIQDISTDLAVVRLAASGSDTQGPFTDGVPLNNTVKVHVNSGSVQGVVWVGIPC